MALSAAAGPAAASSRPAAAIAGRDRLRPPELLDRGVEVPAGEVRPEPSRERAHIALPGPIEQQPFDDDHDGRHQRRAQQPQDP